MRRREFLGVFGGAAAAWPLAARAQQGERVRRIAVLIGYSEDDSETKSRLQAFRAGLAKRGWSDGRNVTIDYRFTAATESRIPILVKELVALQPDVILAHTPPIAIAFQRESRTIPIVFVNVSAPLENGLVQSLARPGGNVTGVLHYEPGIVGKWLHMLKELAPSLARVAVVANPKVSNLSYFVQAAEAALPSLGLALVPIPIENAAADIERVFESLAREPNTGVVIPPDPTTITHRDLIVALAGRHRLPVVYPFDFFVKAGGLMSYGTDQADMLRLAASYVDRILRGDKPADLPVQAVARFETTINLKTAKALGLTVPSGLLIAADEVIE
jgi:putative ABC transport system substrate-binding protein